ncbi:2-C-methyl-D-erythritol 2,4-cyclodiphosphate synthase [Biomaibacter acetigenes]|jgi:2-C-methyl-D-erythritol 2,4-cyclodiphosphate synthase|uniref:2-C-methyl-D-erythritol 2,4-cyclodiphosphate synthase n=1 Tax=Biomaibacter acetigenes TaxID=2316383 RepID=A0A3G2R920_9FIRM|nr:2-C-methyl-D-erythritol 2,4-cyclodiphosphate synthase [Biomaibacter acetigenes]AYO31913.1 2-C-methyl-D-erythritol 2,4-cyclodiphosphate synthase [Biomaibacter acetigenes]MDN5300844.1 2-C-methyl-D-erythritol 2,4-cyclodiphosphate synthase [Thermoanaerobacteraceae bacterium]MDN5311669.1 2-C-methyl-D-erythritol 2,4-cyclodiphosphate synthase [Thermoanaerobacteraceae bacterium]RKL63719.1 2-C-methyl-D-erythritol 2,4-cyclodiphosphate synthase [Thermoanaerobacteraceae bacterium SP2]
MRVGIGFDAHRLVEGRKLVLGGVTIPFEKGLLGHSDADVLVHAINDALLGAAVLGDIGMHFPDTDMQYKDINSLLLLKRVGELLKQAGFGVVNIDSVVCAQRPRLSPYIQKMRQNIAETLNISEDKVSVKATTTEGMGYEGRGEGISAQAICMIKKI